MKKILFLTILLSLAVSASAQIEKITGVWKTVDDKLKVEASVVTIYQDSDGLFYGRIDRMIVSGFDHFVGKMVIIGMKYEDGILKGGKVYDPKSDKTYYGTVKYDPEKDVLILRGSLDKKGVFGRSQTWVK